MTRFDLRGYPPVSCSVGVRNAGTRVNVGRRELPSATRLTDTRVTGIHNRVIDENER